MATPPKKKPASKRKPVVSDKAAAAGKKPSGFVPFGKKAAPKKGKKK